MKLGTKIFLGFSSVISLSAIIGLFSWIAQISYENSFESSQTSAFLGIGIAKMRQQEKNFQLRGFALYGNDKENAYEKWEKLAKQQIGLLTELTSEGASSKTEDLQKSFTAYKNAFISYVDLYKKNNDIFLVWREIGNGFNTEVATIRKNVVRGDGTYIVSDELETAFVLMRVAALYYLKEGTPESWTRFEQSMKNVENKTASLVTSSDKNERARGNAMKISAYIKTYVESALKYRETDLAKFAREKDMIDASRDFENLTGSLIEEQSRKFALTKQIGYSSMIFVLLLTMAIGFMIAGYLTRSISSVTSRAVARLNDTAYQITAAVDLLAESSDSLAKASGNQASSIEETSASMEEFSSMVKRNTVNTQEVNKLAQESKQAADSGDTEIQALISAMSGIVTSSKKIEDIINVIEDITFQTNLLALNAAVEAARAGDHGKGFAVVADAVRDLAQRSSSAAREITTIIKESVLQSDSGAKIAVKSGESLKEIVGAAKKVASLAGEIASANQEQAQGIVQITQAITQIDQSTQSNASTSEKVAQTSRELKVQTESLNLLVDDLAAMISGKSRTSHKNQIQN
ncbi:MAG: methyl-accepting chemotaxis protein [Oligoflexales bacterium]|nr:methyl-accepting chemotaxis protein [Oligoflexales bacterium]